MNPWIDVAGRTLLHFLWQGAGIAAIAFVLLFWLRNRAPQTRYVVACIALVAMVAAPLVTTTVLSRSVATTASHPLIPVPYQSGPYRDSLPDGRSILTNLAMARGLSSVEVATPGPRAWLPLVVLLWSIGVSVLLLRLFGGWWRIHRLHRASLAASASAWTGATARIAASATSRRSFRLRDLINN